MTNLSSLGQLQRQPSIKHAAILTRVTTQHSAAELRRLKAISKWAPAALKELMSERLGRDPYNLRKTTMIYFALTNSSMRLRGAQSAALVLLRECSAVI